MPNTNQYSEIRKCISQLEFVLKEIGVAQLTLSDKETTIVWEMEKETNAELVNNFCENVSVLFAEAKKSKP